MGDLLCCWSCHEVLLPCESPASLHRVHRSIRSLGQTDIFVEKHIASTTCESGYTASCRLPSLTSSVLQLGDATTHVAKCRLLIEGYLPILSWNAQLSERGLCQGNFLFLVSHDNHVHCSSQAEQELTLAFYNCHIEAHRNQECV